MARAASGASRNDQLLVVHRLRILDRPPAVLRVCIHPLRLKPADDTIVEVAVGDAVVKPGNEMEVPTTTDKVFGDPRQLRLGKLMESYNKETKNARDAASRVTQLPQEVALAVLKRAASKEHVLHKMWRYTVSFALLFSLRAVA